MMELFYIIGIPFVIVLLIKFIYFNFKIKEEVLDKDDINLMSEIPNYEKYLRINNDILEN